MEKKFQLLDVVAVVDEQLAEGLVAGQVGTIVEELEVEFSDDEGRTYALVSLISEQLLVLHYSPVAA